VDLDPVRVEALEALQVRERLVESSTCLTMIDACSTAVAVGASIR
jgi:hypothetical protein